MASFSNYPIDLDKHPLWPREKWAILSSMEICTNMYNYIANIKIPANEYDFDEECNKGIRIFDSATESYPITLQDYMKRIVHYMRSVCSPVVMAGSLLLISRFERSGGHRLTLKNVYRVIAIAYSIAYKVMEDEPHITNTKIAQICGMQVKELVALETAFCRVIKFELGMMHDLDLQGVIVDALLPPEQMGCDPAMGVFYRQDLHCYSRTPSPAISLVLGAHSASPSPLGLGHRGHWGAVEIVNGHGVSLACNSNSASNRNSGRGSVTTEETCSEGWDDRTSAASTTPSIPAPPDEESLCSLSRSSSPGFEREHEQIIAAEGLIPGSD